MADETHEARHSDMTQKNAPAFNLDTSTEQATVVARRAGFATVTVSILFEQPEEATRIMIDGHDGGEVAAFAAFLVTEGAEVLNISGPDFDGVTWCNVNIPHKPRGPVIAGGSFELDEEQRGPVEHEGPAFDTCPTCDRCVCAQRMADGQDCRFCGDRHCSHHCDAPMSRRACRFSPSGEHVWTRDDVCHYCRISPRRGPVIAGGSFELDEERTQKIVTTAHAMAVEDAEDERSGEAGTGHATLNGDAAALLDAARSRLALSDSDELLIIWRAEAIRLMGHHDYGRGFKIDDLITSAALAEAIQLRSIPPVIANEHRGHVLDSGPNEPIRACQFCGLIVATASAETLLANCPARERGPIIAGGSFEPDDGSVPLTASMGALIKAAEAVLDTLPPHSRQYETQRQIILALKQARTEQDTGLTITRQVTMMTPEYESCRDCGSPTRRLTLRQWSDGMEDKIRTCDGHAAAVTMHDTVKPIAGGSADAEPHHAENASEDQHCELCYEVGDRQPIAARAVYYTGDRPFWPAHSVRLCAGCATDENMIEDLQVAGMAFEIRPIIAGGNEAPHTVHLGIVSPDGTAMAMCLEQRGVHATEDMTCVTCVTCVTYADMQDKPGAAARRHDLDNAESIRRRIKLHGIPSNDIEQAELDRIDAPVLAHPYHGGWYASDDCGKCQPVETAEQRAQHNAL